MTRRTLAAAIMLVLAASVSTEAAGVCTAVVNGRALEPGRAVCDDGHTLLLSADALREALGLTVLQGETGAPWTIRGFGHSVLVRPNAAAFSVDGEVRQAEAAPELREGALFVPLVMLAETFEIAGSMQRDGGATVWALTTPGAAVLDIREGRHGDRVRIVLDVDRPTGVCWWSQPGLLTLQLPALAEAGGMASSVRLIRMEDELVDQVRQGPTATGTRIEIVHSSTEPAEVFSVADPPRVVVDLLRAPEDIIPEPEPEPVRPLPQAAGVLETRNFSTPRGPVRVHVIDVDPRSPDVQVRPVLAAATVHQRASLTRIVRSSGAWGGINGGFFARTGPSPLGMLVIDGEWVRDPWPARTVLGITPDGRLLMDRLSFDGRVVFGGHGWQPLEAINRGHEKTDTLVLYNRHWGGMVEGARERTRLTVDASGVVTAKTCDGRAVMIPQGGYVLSGIGRMAASLDLIEPGCQVTLDLKTSPHWPELAHAIGGGPRLVKDGQKHITASPEGFRPDVYAGARSRTAAGVTASGRLLMVVAEAVGENGRCGMTLDELAATMIKLGARDAMNLDGGGSTTFVADGRLLNMPSDGAERLVSNGLLVFTQETARAAADGG